MSIIAGLVLIALGLLAAGDYIGQNATFLKKTVDKLNEYAQAIGMVGLLVGFIWLLKALSLMTLIDLRPMFVLGSLLASLLTLVLGLIFALPLLHKFMNEPTPSILIKADGWCASLLPHQKYLGLAALVLGAITLFA